MTAMVVGAIHENSMNACCTHLAEGDFLRSVAHLTQDRNTGTAAITAATAETTATVRRIQKRQLSIFLRALASLTNQALTNS